MALLGVPVGARVAKAINGPSGPRKDISYDVVVVFADGMFTEFKDVKPGNMRPGTKDTDIILAARPGDPVYVSMYGDDVKFIIIEHLDLEDC